jgi:hypothetical protein
MLLVVVNILIIGGLIYFGYTRVEEASLKKIYFPAVVLKLMAGVSLGLVYLFYYEGGDTFNHFNNAAILQEYGFRSWHDFNAIFVRSDYAELSGFAYAIQPQSAAFCKLIAITNLITGSNYWLTGMYFSLFAFSGLWFLSDSIARLEKKGLFAVILLLFYPSLLFWSSGILKETLVVGAMGFLIGIIVDRVRGEKGSWWIILVILILLYFIFLFKYYVAALLGACLLAFFIFTIIQSKVRNPWTGLLFFTVLIFASLALFSRVHPNLYSSRILQVIIDNYQAYAAISPPENMIVYHNLEASWSSVLINSPKALFSGLFGPLTFKHNTFWVGNALENWGLLMITLTVIFFQFRDRVRLLPILYFAIFYVLVLATLLAFAAPNFGTLVRYKVSFMPILFIIIGLGLRPLYSKFHRLF